VDLAGEPMLVRVIERTRRAAKLDEVVVATTTKPADDPIVEICGAHKWPWIRGSESDVLDRYYQAARIHRADIVVRVTSDCPLIDPDIIDTHVNLMLARWHEVDFVTNMMRQTFPLGLAVEVMPLDTLDRLWRLSTTDYLREHVTTLIYEKPELFVVAHVLNDTDLSAMRWTVDTPKDLVLIRRVYEHFRHSDFSWRDVLAAAKQHPEWSDMDRPTE